MPSTTSSPTPSKSLNLTVQQASARYRNAVSQGVRIKIHQLIQAGVLRPTRPNKQCRGNWKPRMDLIDDPALPHIIAIFELPGVKNENITLQIKDKRLVVVGNREDPFAEAVASAMASTTSDFRNKSGTAPNSVENFANVHPDVPKATAGNGPGGAIATSQNKSLRELRYGTFFRSIPVPEGIKQSEVNAGIQDGMLTVAWPRVPAAVQSSGIKAAPAPKAASTSANAMDAISTIQPTLSADTDAMSH